MSLENQYLPKDSWNSRTIEVNFHFRVGHRTDAPNPRLSREFRDSWHLCTCDFRNKLFIMDTAWVENPAGMQGYTVDHRLLNNMVSKGQLWRCLYCFGDTPVHPIVHMLRLHVLKCPLYFLMSFVFLLGKESLLRIVTGSEEDRVWL